MKTIKYLLTVVLLEATMALFSCTENSHAMSQQGSDWSYSSLSFSNNEVESSGDKEVFIRTGPSSKRYHKSSDCMGLSSCSADIRCVTIGYAEELGRTPCKRCY